ncbi:MAG: hypothetical protein KF782_21905 [Labilithrix sp.]|nr:hypothetical protein [Labilithrix sp.]
MPRRRGVSLFLLVAALLGATSRVARANEKQVCVNASEQAQQLRNAGKLSEAREQLAICGRNACPKLVQHDCTEWMREVLAILPSVVPGAKDDKGRDLVDVRVSIDGTVVTESLDGKAIGVDPGVHTFRFEAAGAQAVEEQVVVRQGEKNRIVTVTFAPPAPAEAREPWGGKRQKDAGDGSPPVAAYVTGGVGVLALGAALFINLDASADARELRRTCAPDCAQSEVDDIESRYLIAGVTAGLGGAALIAAAVLYFTHDRGARASASRFVPTITPLTRGVAAAAGFHF